MSRRRNLALNDVKVFSATDASERMELGELMTRWLAEHPDIEISDVVVVQSPHRNGSCVSIALFFYDVAAR